MDTTITSAHTRKTGNAKSNSAICNIKIGCAKLSRLNRIFSSHPALNFLFVAILLSRHVLSFSAFAQPIEPTAAPAPPPTTVQLSPAEAKLREAWHERMLQTPLPKKGCFKAGYPHTEWKEVPCKPAPAIPMPPHGDGVCNRTQFVGNCNDVVVQLKSTSDFITTATGSFDKVSGVTSVSGKINNSGLAVNNAYSLQLNTNYLNYPVTDACGGSSNSQCQGWQQFFFLNNGSSGSVFIQYWLIKYNKACPGGWTTFQYNGSTDIHCWKNSEATSVANQPINNLGQLKLQGTTIVTGGAAYFTDSNGDISSAVGDDAVSLAKNNGWRAAEFGVFGPGGNRYGGSEATFNTGSEIVARTKISYQRGNAPGVAAPVCAAIGYTAETNNLSFERTTLEKTGPGPAMVFIEKTGGLTQNTNCDAAYEVGDTHLATFNGLFYDFQASGDFVLAQVDPDFSVQTRHVSGAPTWPNATVNKAVATRMGKTSVAICLAPTRPELAPPARLLISGKITELGDGKSLSLPDAVDVRREGNVYLVTDKSGNSVRAVANPTWIDVTVGLGRWPVAARGLLANANGNVNEIATRDGIVLMNPFSFEDLYHRYADSWRVSSSESLLRVCGDREIESGIPTKTFYADDLDPKLYEPARAICIAAGVRVGPLLDACTLDVTVIGDNAAAPVFVGLPAPIAVGDRPYVIAPDDSWKWLWLVLALIIVFILGVFLITKMRTTP